MGIGENVGEHVGENTGTSGSRNPSGALVEPTGTIFNDGWESGNMSTTNGDGFAWQSNNATSVVTMNSDCSPSTPDTSIAIYNNGVICNVQPGKDWYAKEGDNSLRFRYAAGANWAENRFQISAFYPDLWVAYWIRVPTNYTRGSGTNNKWFDIWWGTDFSDYDTDGCRIEMQDWPGSPSTNADINIQYRANGGSFTNSSRYNSFMKPADAGKWMHCVYHMIPGTGTGAVYFWRMWEDESSYTLINSVTGVDMATGGNGATGWGAGYLMGYANAAYASDTEFLIDNFRLSESDLRIS